MAVTLPGSSTDFGRQAVLSLTDVFRLRKGLCRLACCWVCLGVSPSAALQRQCFLQGRRRALGNMQFIGHLYRQKMLTERIMHECIKKLLADVSHLMCVVYYLLMLAHWKRRVWAAMAVWCFVLLHL